MTPSTKNILLRIIFFLNIGCLFFLLISDLSIYISPAACWPIAFTGLLFPFLLAATILFVIVWLMIRPKKSILSIIIILLSFPNIKSAFAIHYGNDFSMDKPSNSIRILTWNVGVMNLSSPDTAVQNRNNAIIFNNIATLKPDVICFQEFVTSRYPGDQFNYLDSIQNTYHYPYRYIVYEEKETQGFFYFGTVVYSKYPMTDTSSIIYDKPFSGSVIKAGLLIGKDTIDLFTTRLQSDNLQTNDYQSLHNLKRRSNIHGTKSIVQKLKNGYATRTEQVNIVKNWLAQSTRPHLIMGDFNDVPASYTYQQVKGNMTDVWINRGFGIGRSFRLISPTLRIDFMFCDDRFKPLQVKRIISEASDHYGLVADLELKKVH